MVAMALPCVVGASCLLVLGAVFRFVRDYYLLGTIVCKGLVNLIGGRSKFDKASY